MRTTTIFISISLILFLLSCSLIDKKESLTGEQIENYIETYTQLREEAPEILESINIDPKNAELGKEQYAKIQKIIKEGGFDNYSQFIITNAKIGSIFSILQAETGMENFEDLNENSNKMLDDGIAEIDKILNDPDIPEDIKVEQRKIKEELLKGTKQLEESWKKNKKWADKVMKSTKKFTGLFISEDDIAIVKEYEDKIMEAYTGFQMPELPNGKFPELDLSNLQ